MSPGRLGDPAHRRCCKEPQLNGATLTAQAKSGPRQLLRRFEHQLPGGELADRPAAERERLTGNVTVGEHDVLPALSVLDEGEARLATAEAPPERLPHLGP